MKPFGWRFESHRHALAAKGVRTSYFGKKSMGVRPEDFEEMAEKSAKETVKEQEKINWPGGKKEMRALAKDPLGGGIHNEFDVDGNVLQKPLVQKPLPTRDGIMWDEEKRMALRKKDAENKEYFDEIHDMTDAEEIKDILKDMKEEYKEFGMTDAQAAKRAKVMLEKSKSYGTALSTTDDPDEFMALKDNLAWFTGEKTDEDQSKWAFGDSRDVQSQKVDAFNAYASDPAEFEKSSFFAKKKSVPKKCGQCGKWHDHLHGGKADKMQPWMFNQKELKRGTKHEMEHTTNKKIAQEISMDHLAEDKAYYKKLEKVEKV